MFNLILLLLTVEFVFANLHQPNSHFTTLTFNSTTSGSVNDLEIREVLVQMASGKLGPNDYELMELIKNGIMEAAEQENSNLKSSLRAGAKKAQLLVTDVTAAYTQAIFKSKSSAEAQRILHRFQNTIQMIVDFTKNGKYVP